MRNQKPTHTSITNLLAKLLPPKEADLSRTYHVPRHPRYDPSISRVDHILLSITPTTGVYERIEHVPPHRAASSPSKEKENRRPPRPPRTVAFLHRPFNLDRRRVRRGTLILASHTAFDEVLTVGYNTVLAGRLGLDVPGSVCVKGYKGDDERRIGIVGRVKCVGRSEMVGRIRGEFGGDVQLERLEAETEGQNGKVETKVEQDGAGEDDVQVVAIMNAFNPETVQRVMDAAISQGWLETSTTFDSQTSSSGNKILYLTGQPRQTGMEAATALGMAVVCVGHRQAEEWGIRYLAERFRADFPGVSVEEVFEDEQEIPKPIPREKKPHGANGVKRDMRDDHGPRTQHKAGE